MKIFKTIITTLTLTIGGILITSGVNAMTYTIDGNFTQVIIPSSNSSGITINRGEENSEASTPQSVTNCSELQSVNEINEPVYKCEHIYTSSGHYLIKIDNVNKENVKKISLESGNVTNINDFTGFENLNEIYLKNNKLNTIPQIIWESRKQAKTIKLSNTISYNNETGTKYIDLRNNNIKFIGITKIGNYNLDSFPSNLYPNFHNTTQYNFEWFAYSEDNAIYKFSIIDSLDLSQITSGTGIINTGITINNIPLNSGTYYFDSCIQDTKICEGKFFTVSYDESINFSESTHPSSGETLSTIENIKFARNRTGNTPDEFISGYIYNLSKDGKTISEGLTGNNSYNLDLNLIIDDPNGDYTFTVNLINSNGTVITSINRSFTILIPASITIELPNSNESSSSIQFSRNYSLPAPYTFTGYTYTLTKGNNIIKSGTISTINNTGFKINNLENGNYTFEIIMKYLNNGIIKNTYDKKTFTIAKQTNTNGGSNGGYSTNYTNNNISTGIFSAFTGTKLPLQNIESQLNNNTEDEIYIARNCKEYRIEYSKILNAFTSPDLKKKEYFINKEYFKRYIDSKNPYKRGCPTNVGWININYVDKNTDNDRYTAPNGKIYFIAGQEGNYYSNEFNKKSKTSFKTIQDLKLYIKNRNPLISMGYQGINENLNNTNTTTITKKDEIKEQSLEDNLKELKNNINTTNSIALQEFDELFDLIQDKSGGEKNNNSSTSSSNTIIIEREDGVEGSLFTFYNQDTGLKKINIIRRDNDDEHYILSKRENGEFELDSNENGKTIKTESINDDTIIEEILPNFRKYL